MKTRIITIIAVLIVAAVAVWYFFLRQKESTDIIIKPTVGLFKLIVTTSGELQAKNSIDIVGPAEARSVGVYQMKISKLVTEGTIVKAGEFVADLDKSEIMAKIKEIDLSVQKYQSQYLQSTLDSTLNLSNSRDELENLKFAVEEKHLIQEQSQYEPPATQRQVEIDLARAERSYTQSIKNYTTKVQQAIAKLSEVGADLSKEKQRLDKLLNIMQSFTILAPADGMVIFAKEWSGKSITVGSTISAWDPVVATLPDLNDMESVTYVNEVDIQKVKVGQNVNISLDANPNKKLTGTIVKVANIGEQKKGSESKVFQVNIKINEKDTTLLPSMTTSNEIIVSTIENSLFIPLECVHAEDSFTFVYKKIDGEIIKQEVVLGQFNENEAIISKGVEPEDDILLSVPANEKDLRVVKLN